MRKFGISKELEELAIVVEEEIKEVFKKIDKACSDNSFKVLKAFNENNISEIHFNSTTGYGYGDIGREAIEKVFANVLGAEDSLVRNQIISGTHALTICLFGVLRPKDTVLSITGKPYDTLDSIIGIKENNSSLKSYGINYEQIDLINNNFNIPQILERIDVGAGLKTCPKLVFIQRSKGYSQRKSICIWQMEEVISKIREKNKEIIIMVDNCYGEFVEEKEPTAIGADIIAGSLIKNLGGGLVPSRGIYSRKKRFGGIVQL